MPAPQVGKRPPEESKSKKGAKDDPDETKGGHVLVPDQKYLVNKLSEVNPNLVYFLVYVRNKTEAEMAAEVKASGPKDTKSVDLSEKSVRSALQTRVSTFAQSIHIKLNDSYVKTHRPRGGIVPLYCPFSNCMREFHETGNLKTHIRIHVSYPD